MAPKWTDDIIGSDNSSDEIQSQMLRIAEEAAVSKA